MMDQSETNRRRKILILIIIVAAIAVSLITLILVLVIGRNGLDCDLTDIEPDRDHSRDHINRLVSSDYRAIASFDGYIRYQSDVEDQDTKIFLPLSVQSIQRVLFNQMETLTLSMDCAELSLSMEIDSFLTYITIISAKLKRTYSNKSHYGTNTCYVYYSDMFKYKTENHYKCDNFELDCNYVVPGTNTTKTLFTIYINELEFETDGDRYKYSKNEFSKPAQDCLKSITSGNKSNEHK